MRARLIVSDPWEFLEENGTPEMYGEVANINANSLSVDLDREYVSGGVHFRRVDARPRHEGGGFDALTKNEVLPVNIEIDVRHFLVGSISLIGSEQ